MEENEKMEMETADITQQNIDKIAELFPNCVTEIEDKERSAHDHKIYKKGINFDRLRQMLSNDIVEGYEAYDFTWVGKKASLLEAHKPIRKTLRPCINESLNWDTTENLYIEGDNLEVLKLLRESYLNKVKMIYIDPPYNRGKDFIYKDNYSQAKDEYDEAIGACDEDGNRLFKNTDSNGRFHSDWCSMIYPRLLLARDLLREDGVIFISIDDHEVANLRKICDEVFGEKNFVAQFTRKGSGGRQDSKYYAIVHEYILCYTKNRDNFISGKDLKTDVSYPFYDDNKKLHYKTQLLRKWGENSRRSDRPNLYYPIIDPDGNEHFPMISSMEESCWRWGKDKMFQEIQNGNVEFKKKNNEWIAYEKIYEPTEDNPDTKLYTSIIDDISNSTGASLLKTLFNDKVFSYPKPVDLIIRILKLGNFTNSDVILDFFSGSATTAHAVMQLNAEDGGNRKFIMVQLPESCDEKSEAFKAGYKNICEIGKERIRRAGAKIKEEHPESAENLDVGFRVFKVDESNMKDVYFSAQEYDQNMLPELESNIKPDRTDLDLLFGCLLESGVPLSMPHKSEKIDGYTVHTYGDGDQIPLIACFEENIPDSVIDTIAKRQPLRVVLRDSCFKDSAAKINILERFKTFSPNTDVRVI